MRFDKKCGKLRRINATLLFLILTLPICLIWYICPVQASILQEASTLDFTIYDVTVSEIGFRSAVVQWKTNVNATSQIFYDTRFHYYIENYDYHTPEDDTLVSEHSIRLNSLMPGANYNFRVRSVAGSNEATSDDYTFRTLSYNSGGDGSGGGTTPQDYSYLTVNVEGDITEWPIDVSGHLITTVNALSINDEISIHIPVGTRCLNPERRCLHEVLACCENEDIDYCTACARDRGYTILGKTYDIGPNGSTFSPYAEVTLFYDEQDIPAGLTENDLCIGWCDGDDWVPLESNTNTAANSVLTKVSHLSIFSVMTKPPAQPPPAKFVFDSLNINPAEVDAGEKVTISTRVKNTGGSEGTSPVSLWIDNTLVETKEVVLSPNENEIIIFTVKRLEPGNYYVTVAGLNGSFSVKEAAVPSPEPLWPPPARNNWLWLLLAIIVSIIVFISVRLRRGKDDVGYQ